MVIVAVANFMAAIKPSIEPSANQSFTKNDLLKLKRLAGYGMACSGDGMVGAYKLQMKFGEITSFVTKIPLGYRGRLQAAGMIDFMIQYHQKWGNITSDQ